MPNPIPPDVPRVVVNEVVSSPAEPFEDAVELQNLSGSAVDIGGWFLSDDLEVPAKFRFPPGTVLASGGYLALDEHTFNPDGLGWPLPGSIPFSFNADGDDVYLFSANAAGELTGYVDGFSFGPAETNRPFGRYVTSIGEAHVVALREITLLESNAEPQVGPLVISRIHYHPPDWVYSGCVVSNNTVDEFLELRNITEAPLTLSDPGVPGGQWRLRSGVEYPFPAGLTLPPGGRVVVTGSVATNMWEWSAFRMRNGIADETLVLGPWEGALNNGGESVELVRPVVVRGQAAELLVERVRYSNRAPWPILADGLGGILRRRDLHRYADDPANWVAAGPGSEPVDPNAPLLVVEPSEALRLAALGGSVRLEVRASGASIAGYQWLHDGRFIAGATNADLVLEPVTSLDAGTYLAMVFAADGRMGASSFTVVVGAGANIYLQPGHQTVRVPPDPAAAPSTNAVFQVGAETEHPPLRYQWRFNGRPIEGATGSSLTVENVTTNDFGAYSCAVTDEIGTVLSASAMLYPIVQLGFLQRPVPSLIVTPGSVVALSCVVTGFPPPFDFEWRIGSVPLLRTTNADPFSIFTLVAPNVPATNQYRVVVRHYSNLAPGLPSNPQTVVITAVDSDGDGLPDLREDALPGFDKNNPLDALGDDDGDGMTNGDEWVAGTDPRDPQSYLRLELPFGVVPGLEVGPMLSFTAISNRVYAVEAREGLEEAGLWRKVAEVPALGTNRVVTVQDRQAPGVAGQQIYRLVTPRQ